jgi:purine-binding chemotaxis protein CheW
MSKSLMASNKVMKNYLSELLTEETAVLPKEKEKSLAKLLEKVNVVEKVAAKTTVTAPPKVTEELAVNSANKISENTLVTAKSAAKQEAKAKKVYREGDFQAMFFEVAGLTIAVPLIELGGIHQVEKITALMGKPAWFQGVMVHRDEKINVVDTALWVMPEKYDQKLKDSLNYQYIIMLNDSNWGLSAEKLVDTVTLKQSDVKWLDNPSKRPWLAGLVKDRMCALLEVDALIKLLSDGAGNTT